MASNNNIDTRKFSWGGGLTTLFLKIGECGKPIIFDVEYDRQELHEIYGGRTTYISCSGYSGDGYLKNLGELLPLGMYRVDTVHNNFQEFLPIGSTPEGKEVFVAVPYISHEQNKSEILREHPTVVKVGPKVVYCDFETNFVSILSLLLSGKGLPSDNDGIAVYGRRYHRTLRRVFTLSYGGGMSAFEEEIVLEHYNMCSMMNTPNSWEFYSQELGVYQSDWYRQERVFQLLGIEKLKGGTFINTVNFDGIRYRGEILPDNPLKSGELTAGWRRLEDGDVLVRFYDGSNEAHILTYAEAEEAYGKVARRLANKMGEGEEFVSFVSAHDGEYVEFERVVPKVLYLLNATEEVAEVRKGLAKKVREDVIEKARQWVEEVNDRSILEGIPDELIITFEDSLAAGNCRPGTEAFVARYFPGQTRTTARELKRFSDNYDVMRIFRYLADAGRFAWKGKTAAV